MGVVWMHPHFEFASCPVHCLCSRTPVHHWQASVASKTLQMATVDCSTYVTEVRASIRMSLEAWASRSRMSFEARMSHYRLTFSHFS